MRTTSTGLMGLVLSLLLGLLLLGGALASAAASAAPAGQAYPVQQGPLLDGDVLGDPAWTGVIALSDFTQIRPAEGEPASQRTEVFLGFDEDNLYVGVVCYDTQPSGIIMSSSRRDADLDQEDSFRFVIDGVRSEQDGFVFGTNPAGVEYDGQLNSTGVISFGESAFDLNWDTTWEVASRVHETGWSAEFAIPFSSLRYGSGAVQTWNMNFQRNIRRSNEVSFWAPVPLQYGLNRLSLAGAVSGVRAPKQRNLQVTPYVLGKSVRGGTLAERQNDEEAGFDLKYSLTPSLTLDVTYNTDFAQVEADQQQINLDRFSLFFPEKRPFFLENANQFRVGIPGQVDLFFSRRIGIGPAGEQLPIDGGLRISGKLGASTNVGFLQMRSEAVAGVAPETDFTVARVNQEFANRSSLGALLVNKDAGDTDNQTFAVDGQWGIGEDASVYGFVAQTQTDDISDDDHALRIGARQDGEAWSYSGSYLEVGEGFNPEVGFLSRRGYRHVDLFLQRRIRMPDSHRLLELRPHASYRGFWDFDGYYETGFVHIDSSVEWKSGSDLHTAINLTHEGVREAFEIVDGVTVAEGEYDNEEVSVFAGTDRSAPLNMGMQLVVGGFFGGDRFSASPYINYRIGETFSARLSVNHNDVKLPGGDFKVNLSQLRLSYAFSPRISVQAFVQHNDRDDLLATNLRFSWLRSANSGLFVVYNEVDDERLAPGRPRREFILKYSHIVDLI